MGNRETPIIAVAPAIANAVHDAVGVRIKGLPITAEKVWEARKNLPDSYRTSPERR